MTKLVSVLTLTLAAGAAMADDFVGAGFGIPDVGGGISSVNVSGLGPVTGMTVTINLYHSYANDTIIRLTGPSGTINLFYRGVLSGEAFVGTYILDDAAAIPFQNATTDFGSVAPGTYSPLDSFHFFTGSNPNGTWTLAITDHAGGDSGHVNSWTLSIVPTPGAAAALGLGGLTMVRRRRPA